VETVFLPALLKAAPQRLRARLWAARSGAVAPALPDGRTSLPVDPAAPEGFYAAVGFHVLGGKAVRVDMLERFAAEVRRLSREKTHVLPPGLLTLLGATVEEAPEVLAALGYEATTTDEGLTFKPRPRRRNEKAGKGARRGKAGAKGPRPPGQGRKPSRKDLEDSPFAVLRDLVTITA
jgi:ATP-dependent RNA helicase SUPV3L1/SUV3